MSTGSSAAGVTPAESSRKILIPLQGFLIQGVPYKWKSDFTAEQLIEIQNAKGRSRYFVIRKNALLFVNKLDSLGWKISVYDPQPINEINQLLSQIELKKDESLTLDKVIETIISGSPSEDISKIAGTVDLSNEPLNDYSMIVGLKEVSLKGLNDKVPIFDLGHSFFAFQSYSRAASARAAFAEISAYAPTNDQEWESEANKVARVFFVINLLERENTARWPSFIAEYRSKQSLEVALNQSRVGTTMLEDRFSPEARELVIDPERVQAQNCQVKDSITKKTLRTESLDICLNYLSKELSPQAFWIETDKRKCGLFSKNLILLKMSNACEGSRAMHFNKSRRQWVPFEWTEDLAKLDSKAFELQILEGVACLSFKKGLDATCARWSEKDSLCKYDRDLMAWDRSSCLNLEGKNGVLEILKLENGESINPVVFQKYSLNKIAESMIERGYQKNQRSRMVKEDIVRGACDMFHDVFPLMAFNASRVDAIIKSGFLNLHQTKHGNGCVCTDERIRAESRLSALNMEAAPKSLLPKYAYGMSYNSNILLSPRYIGTYGEIFARFKSKVNRRTTFTAADSLSDSLEGESLYFCGSEKIVRRGAYYEAQIWGDLVWDDVEYLMVNCPELPESLEAVVQTLKDNNKDTPVFLCENRAVGNGVVPFPTKQVYGRPFDLEKHLNRK